MRTTDQHRRRALFTAIARLVSQPGAMVNIGHAAITLPVYQSSTHEARADYRMSASRGKTDRSASTIDDQRHLEDYAAPSTASSCRASPQAFALAAPCTFVPRTCCGVAISRRGRFGIFCIVRNRHPRYPVVFPGFRFPPPPHLLRDTTSWLQP